MGLCSGLTRSSPRWAPQASAAPVCLRDIGCEGGGRGGWAWGKWPCRRWRNQNSNHGCQRRRNFSPSTKVARACFTEHESKPRDGFLRTAVSAEHICPFALVRRARNGFCSGGLSKQVVFHHLPPPPAPFPFNDSKLRCHCPTGSGPVVRPECGIRLGHSRGREKPAGRRVKSAPRAQPSSSSEHS